MPANVPPPGNKRAPAGPKSARKDDGKPKTPAKYYFHSKRILDGIVIVFALFTLLFARVFRPGFWSTLVYALLSLPAGVVLSFIYHSRKRKKDDVRKLYTMEPGAKGLAELVHRVPTWLTLSHSEKCEWLNDILEELWPFYDYAVCEMLKETLTPTFESIKPPGFRKIDFAKLQFGDAPIRIEAVRMDRERKDGIFLEMDFRWAGEPEIHLAIQLAGTEKSPKLVPKITHVRMVGTLGVHLRPLVDEIPGFGAVIVTLIKPPKINYKVDLGTVGGKFVGSGVAAFVDGLLPDILNGFLVWPQRIVTPLFDEKVTGPLEALKLHHEGILKVQVLEARDIPRADRMGLSDPFVRIFTDPKRKVQTKTKKKTLAPVWDGEKDDAIHFVMVQEPLSQMLRWEMFDVDFVNVKRAVKSANIFKGMKESVMSEDSMCKGELLIKDVCVSRPGQTIDHWFSMGSEDWSNDEGPGKDCGELKLRLTYVPLDRSNPMVGDYGALFVYAKKGTDFPRMNPRVATSCNPFFTARVGDQKKTSLKLRNTTEPDWTDNEIGFYGVSNSEELVLKFQSAMALAGDEELGVVTIEIKDVRQGHMRGQRGLLGRQYDLKDADSGSINIECLFVAYF